MKAPAWPLVPTSTVGRHLADHGLEVAGGGRGRSRSRAESLLAGQREGELVVVDLVAPLEDQAVRVEHHHRAPHRSSRRPVAPHRGLEQPGDADARGAGSDETSRWSHSVRPGSRSAARMPGQHHRGGPLDVVVEAGERCR